MPEREPRVAVVVPALGLQSALDTLLPLVPSSMELIVVDDGSAPPLRITRGVLLRHERNLGYGAAQKSGYREALARGAERVVLLHGDAQYEASQVLALVKLLDHADAATGTRFASSPPNHVPSWRRFGIRALTGLANLRFHTDFSDLHNGARAFRAETLRCLPLEDFSDDFLFDQQLIVELLGRGMTLVEKPVSMHYHKVSSISFRGALRYGLGCVASMAGVVR